MNCGSLHRIKHLQAWTWGQLSEAQTAGHPFTRPGPVIWMDAQPGVFSRGEKSSLITQGMLPRWAISGWCFPCGKGRDVTFTGSPRRLESGGAGHSHWATAPPRWFELELSKHPVLTFPNPATSSAELDAIAGEKERQEGKGELYGSVSNNRHFDNTIFARLKKNQKGNWVWKANGRFYFLRHVVSLQFCIFTRPNLPRKCFIYLPSHLHYQVNKNSQVWKIHLLVLNGSYFWNELKWSPSFAKHCN